MKTLKKGYFGFMLIFCVSCFVIFSGSGMAADPKYPTKPIEFLITMAPGGTMDISCRALCEAASKHLGQAIMPINKPAAGGALVATIIKESKPDGYRIGILSRPAAFVIPFAEKVSYDPATDFTSIIYFGDYVDILMVRGDSPWKTWKELIDWAKKHPGEIKIGMPGAKYMQVQGIALGQIELKENVKFTYIPFKGASETLTALLGGNIDVYSTTVGPSTMDYLKTGKLRILAFAGKIKLPGYENIPSTEELYKVSVCNLIGVVGPGGMPSYITKTLIDAFQKAIKDPAFVDVMQKMYTPIVDITGDEMGKYIVKTYKEQKEVYELLKKEEAKSKSP